MLFTLFSNEDIILKVVRDGFPFVIVPLLVALLLAALGWGWGFTALLWLTLPCLLLAAFMAYFFRDPERTIPAGDDVVVSPADGQVTRVAPLAPGEADSPNLVSIFLSPLDVHINRAPIAGRIQNVSYTKGRFLMATRADASLLNEQNALTIQGEQITVVCKQIAGILARRIVCWVQTGDEVARGERFGLIKFSSRTDLILPPNVEIQVTEGMRVKGGATIIGKVRS